MGQYWQVINLDRRETYRGWGKLGEFLFTRLPHRVARSLMMDPPFPDRDSLIFPFKPGAVCEETRKHSTRPLPSTYFPQTASQSSSLTNLPVEMIQRIYFGTDDISDVVCLSVTCQLLWEIGRQEIYARLASSVVKDSWAGDRIVCIGDYLRNDDIPEGLLTPEEVEEFIGLDDEGYERTLYEYPFKAISRHRGNIRIWEDFAQRFYLPDPIFAARLPDWGTYTALQKLVAIEYTPPSLALPELVILRNLSRHQYIRESALIAWQEASEIAETEEIGLGHIIVSRICYSSDPSVSMSWDGNIHRGVWAGDRFDLVGSVWLQTLGDDVGWTDVSDEVLQEMEGIWRSEYGPRR